MRWRWRIYQVFVDDNFKFMDEDERVTHGVFESAEEAVAACRAIVDEWLASAFEPGMSSEALWQRYMHFGDDPFIVPVDPKGCPVVFSGWDYAHQRCSDFATSQPRPSSP